MGYGDNLCGGICMDIDPCKEMCFEHEPSLSLHPIREETLSWMHHVPCSIKC